MTGAPSCSKTTIIDLLSANGYKTVAEVARPYIEQEQAKGRSLDEIYNCCTDEYNLKELQHRCEKKLHPDDLLFLDRAMPDCLAFYRMKGMDPNQILAECFHYRYASVFILDRLPIDQDGLRLDDDSIAAYLDHWHNHDYTALRYPVIHVPVLSTSDRLAFVNNHLP